MFACLYQSAASERPRGTLSPLVALACDFSPRYERHTDTLVSIDIGGLERLLGTPRAIGEELRRDAAARGLRVHVAVAPTRTAALVLALAAPGLTVIESGDVRDALADTPIAVLEKFSACTAAALPDLATFRTWGLKTLGEVAALPSADLAARLGIPGLVCQAIARGEDIRPLVPTRPEDRFEASLDLEWPIDGLEPLSFVLTRLLEPLSTQLERRDRGAAVLHVRLRLTISRTMHERSLQLPSPIRDVRTLRTLAVLDLESHPAGEPIDRVTVAIDPTPGRVLQHTLFTRAQPTPEQLSTLLARLTALMGQDRVGAPATVDSYRPGAFDMNAFPTDWAGSACGQASAASAPARGGGAPRGLNNVVSPEAGTRDERRLTFPPSSPPALLPIPSALRRCREPVPARVTTSSGHPIRVTTDRRGFVGGAVLHAAGPWRSSGQWWAGEPSWNRDEWDVALSDGAVYRVFQDRETDAWFIEAIVD